MGKAIKQIIFSLILIYVFCFVAFSQTDKSSCPKIKIKIPDNVRPEETFKVFASFESEKQPSTSKFNWTIIKGDEASKEYNAGIIEIMPGNLDGEEIIVLAESINENCQNFAMAKTILVFPGDRPSPIEDYSSVRWIEEKARLDNVAFFMQGNKDRELLAFLYFDKQSSQIERKDYLQKILNYLSETGNLDKQRITFFISESDKKRIYFQPASQDFTAADHCRDCLIFKAEDFNKLENLFSPKPSKK